MTIPSKCIICNSILSFGRGFRLFGIAIIIVIYRTVCGTSVVIQEVWISHIDGHLHHWYINSLRVIATIGFQILNINITIHRYPVWMPRTKSQCMKCHRFMCLGVCCWGVNFLVDWYSVSDVLCCNSFNARCEMLCLDRWLARHHIIVSRHTRLRKKNDLESFTVYGGITRASNTNNLNSVKPMGFTLQYF